MSHLIRIHQTGIQHNDFEPRNVVWSKSSGPTIIDFDNASVHFSCKGNMCDELVRAAQWLELNIGGWYHEWEVLAISDLFLQIQNSPNSHYKTQKI